MERSESIGDRVRRLREGAGMTQAELADDAGISRPSLNEVETGVTARPRRGTLDKIAQVLGVSLQYLQTGGKAADVKAVSNSTRATTMRVADETEMEKQLKRENESLREQLKLLTEILRSGGDLSRLSNFNLGDQDAAETYVHQRIVVNGFVQYRMGLAA